MNCMNKKRPDLKIIWLLHHDKAMLSHTLLLSSVNFWKKEKLKFSHIPRIISTLLYAIFGFWALKWELRNRHFELDIKLMTAINRFFQDFLLEFRKTMTAEWERMLTCIANDGSHFEKDVVDRNDDK